MIPYINLKRHYVLYKKEIDDTVNRVMKSGRFTGGEEVELFEHEMAEYLKVDHVVGCNSCTDAMIMSLRAMGIGGEVITVSHTFIATIGAIILAGAKPVFVDIGDDFNIDTDLIEDAITPNTRAILPVHLNGLSCDMCHINMVAAKHGLQVVEDTAQAIGAKNLHRFAGTVGDIGCFSLNPMKTLHGIGSGGFIATWNKKLAGAVRILRDHGQDKGRVVTTGYESKMGSLQAAIARMRLKYLDDWILERRIVAARYNNAFNLPNTESTYSNYPMLVNNRSEVLNNLKNIAEVQVRWATPIHEKGFWNLPKTEHVSDHIISLPIYPELTEKEQDIIIKEVKNGKSNQKV